MGGFARPKIEDYLLDFTGTIDGTIDFAGANGSICNLFIDGSTISGSLTIDDSITVNGSLTLLE